MKVYKKSKNRILIMAIIFAIMILYEVYLALVDPIMIKLVILFGTSLIVIYLLLEEYFGKLIVTNEGIIISNLFFKKKINWNEVERLEKISTKEEILIYKNKYKIQISIFTDNWISSELRKEIIAKIEETTSK
jgi:hypothetical protein